MGTALLLFQKRKIPITIIQFKLDLTCMCLQNKVRFPFPFYSLAPFSCLASLPNSQAVLSLFFHMGLVVLKIFMLPELLSPKESLPLFKNYIYLCVHTHTCMCACVYTCIWKSQDNSQESVFSSTICVPEIEFMSPAGLRVSNFTH